MNSVLSIVRHLGTVNNILNRERNLATVISVISIVRHLGTVNSVHVLNIVRHIGTVNNVLNIDTLVQRTVY